MKLKVIKDAYYNNVYLNIGDVCDFVGDKLPSWGKVITENSSAVQNIETEQNGVDNEQNGVDNEHNGVDNEQNGGDNEHNGVDYEQNGGENVNKQDEAIQSQLFNNGETGENNGKGEKCVNDDGTKSEAELSEELEALKDIGAEQGILFDIPENLSVVEQINFIKNELKKTGYEL